MPFDLEAPAEVTARDRVIQLRDFLAALPDEKFNIKFCIEETEECGTVACISGWGQTLFPGPESWFKVLGLTDEQINELFTPAGWFDTPHRYPRARAVAVLDHYLTHGVIDWSAA